MRFTRTGLNDIWVIDPEPREDGRGRFQRVWCAKEFAQHGLSFSPVQANTGYSLRRGTVRGMHFQQEPAVEAKLVYCTRGAMFDVVLDLRPESSSYLKWFGVELTPENARMIFVPEGCAHGYQSLEDRTEMYYMTSAFYEPSLARGVRYDDPAFGIQWPLAAIVISEQDHNWPLVAR